MKKISWHIMSIDWGGWEVKIMQIIECQNVTVFMKPDSLKIKCLCSACST